MTDKATTRSGLPRTHQDYWSRRLFQNSYTVDGRRAEVPEFSVKIQFNGRRETFALGEANKPKAAAKARDIYASLMSNGWAPTLAKFKPETQKKIVYPTVGDYINAARAVSAIRPSTFEVYASKFRTIVAGVTGISGGDDKFNYFHGGSAAYRQKIESIRLDKVTPEAIQRWSISYLQKASENPAKLNSAKTSLNSLLRGGRCLFVSRITRHLSSLTLPSPLPFEGVETPRAPRKRYVSKFSALTIFNLAEELKKSPDVDGKEMFCILSLALFAGLRRDEIDTLQWSQIDFEKGRVQIETNEFTTAKSNNSEATVSLAPDMVQLLKEKKETTPGQFVIISPIEPKPAEIRYHHYRCDRLFQKLTNWLKANGVSDRQPLHTLRKEFGSAIARKFGIFAASEALRHGDIRLTRDYYLAPDNRATFGPADLGIQR